MKLMKIISFVFVTSILSGQDVFVQLADSQMDSTLSGNIEVTFSSSSDIGGFQFQMTGGVLESASGGIADENGFMTSTSEIGMVQISTQTMRRISYFEISMQLTQQSHVS